MIFTVDDSFGEPKTPGYQYIKDDKGYIMGSVISTGQGWSWQSCDNAVHDSWSDPATEPTRQDAINAAIADYIARRME